VPHIFATTDHDAIFALGYVHAQDRLWQLEMNRRIGNGRLAEVLGEPALAIDKYQRTMGYRRVSEQAWEYLSERGQATLQAYADGINGYLAEGKTLPPEFILLGFKPEPWTVYDSLVWMKMMQYDLGGDYEMELLRAQAGAALGPERAAQILPAYPEDGVLILPDGVPGVGGAALDRKSATALLDIRRQMQTLIGITGREKGSNDWVIGGSRTDTGMPILADDPHLASSIPSIWYLAEVQGDTLHVTGATFPALPLFPIGHNEQIAWGVTNMGPDVQDLYLERVNPANPNQVEVNGAWVDMTIVDEEIRVSGRDAPINWAARATRNGPLLSDVSSTPSTVALRWTALDPDDTTFDAYLGINYARNWDEFKAAMAPYIAPSQNFVYADVEGNIGYFAPGRVPIRKAGDGMLPVPGWNDDYAWTGSIPVDEMPHIFNPAADYVATANNRVVDESYPYMLGNDWAPPYRAERIVELIEQKSSGGESISVDDMAVIQADQAGAEVQEILPFIQALVAKTDRQREALGYLQAWDGVSRMESVAQTLYAAWRVEFERALFEDELSGDLYDEFASMSVALFGSNVLADETLGRIWCDNVNTVPREGCPETGLLALDRAIASLETQVGTNMARWTWGTLHQTQYPHRPFSDVAYLKWLFHRTVPNGGDAYTVNVAPFRRSDLYNQYHVPGYRHVVDLQDFNRSLFMTTTGQSGNVLSPHYDDFIERHRDVEYLPMTFGRDRVTGDVLTLRP
jgi:penicillin amidase